MTTPHGLAPAPSGRRWHQRLRRELLWALAVKLVLLLALKAVFFPQRLSQQEAANGVAERLATATAPSQPTISKEKP